MANYNNNYNNNHGGGYNKQTYKKRSGAKSGIDKHGRPYVNGWNANGRGEMISIIAAPYSSTRRHVGEQRGNSWENWCAKVQIGKHKPELHSCLYEVSTGRVIIKDLGFVMNPKTNYTGTFTRKK